MAYVNKEKLRDILYEEDAITFKGLKILNTFPEEDVVEASKWIDIKERLPKDNEKVLCLCQSDIYDVLTWDNVQMEWVHDSNHIYFKTFVRYWQPLPEYPSDAKMDGERKRSN